MEIIVNPDGANDSTELRTTFIQGETIRFNCIVPIEVGHQVCFNVLGAKFSGTVCVGRTYK